MNSKAKTGKLSRLEVAKRLKLAVGYLWFKKRYAVVFELGVTRWGTRRADVIANSVHGHIVIVEVKSSIADFRADDKLSEYMGHADKFYLAYPHPVWLKIKQSAELLTRVPREAGVITLGPSGWARIVQPAFNLYLEDDPRMQMLARLAWRSAELSKRTQRARHRVYL